MSSKALRDAGSPGCRVEDEDRDRRGTLHAPFEVVARDYGVIELHPLLSHRADPAWFWTEWVQIDGQPAIRWRRVNAHAI